MESSSKLLPQVKAESTSKYGERFAKFEEFRLRREKEKQERLARIEQRKKELRNRRVAAVQKSLSSLNLNLGIDNIKQNAAHIVEKPQPSNTLSTDIKQHVAPVTCGQPRSVVKNISARKENTRRMTYAAHGLPSMAKKLVGERVRPRYLARLSHENIAASQRSPRKAVKRQLLASGDHVPKKPCLEPRSTNIRFESIRLKNADKNLKKADSCFETGRIKSKKDDTLIISEAVLPKNENNRTTNDNGRKLTRAQELELWRQKKSQLTADLKGKAQAQPRRETLPATRPVLSVFSSAVKSSAVGRMTSVTQQIRAEASKKKQEKGPPVYVKSRIDSVRTKPAQLNRKYPTQTDGKVVAGAKNLQAIPNTKTLEKITTVRAAKPELQGKSGKAVSYKRDKTLLLETVLSASEPDTPELKGPRMSTPYSSKDVKSPCDALQLSAIVGGRMKCLTSTWTPKTPKTPSSALGKKLQEWLAAHGKTPSRYRHLACHGVHVQDVSTPLPSSHHRAQKLSSLLQHDVKQVNIMSHDEMQEVETQLIEMFAEVTSLQNMGCPSEYLTTWLNNVSEKIPSVKQMAHYWSCRACFVAAEKDGYDEAIQILEEGTRNGAQPEEELEKARTYINEGHNRSVARASNATFSSRKRLANEVQSENVFDSSSVKFSVKRIANLQSSFVTPQRIVVTPVRRSTRRSCARLPAGLRDHDMIVESVDEIPAEMCPATLFKSNIALNLQWRFLEPDASE